MKHFLAVPIAAVAIMGLITLTSSCKTTSNGSTVKDDALPSSHFVAEYCGANGFESFNSGSARKICTGMVVGLHPFALQMKVDGKPDSIYEIHETEYDSNTRLRLLLARDGSQVGELTIAFRRQGNKEIYEHISGTLEGIAVDLALSPVQSSQPSTPQPSQPAQPILFTEKFVESCNLASKPNYEIGLYSSNNPNVENILRVKKGTSVVFERRLISRAAGELQVSIGHVPENLAWYYDIPGDSGGFEVFVLAGSIYRHKPVDQNTGVPFIASVTLLNMSEKVDGQTLKGELSCKKVEISSTGSAVTPSQSAVYKCKSISTTMKYEVRPQFGEIDIINSNGQVNSLDSMNAQTTTFESLPPTTEIKFVHSEGDVVATITEQGNNIKLKMGNDTANCTKH